MDSNELKEILDRHLHWLNADCDGWEDMRADLCEAELRGADLRGADLREADLRGANLRVANLCVADLCGADLSGANLCGANLWGAVLWGADLRGAILWGANLSGADLSGAYLSEKQLRKFFPICCPEYGAFIGWKRASNYIIKLEICEDAKRSSAFGRKCRASKARCLSIENLDGSDSGLLEVVSRHDKHFVYRVGEISEVENFDEDRTHECAPGIHFFITRQEAVNYNC